MLPWLALLTVGCVTTAPRSRTPGAQASVLEGVPVRRFTVQECGAGSLSAVLNYLGDPISQTELQTELPKAANGGVLSLDLLLAARARGFEADLVEGTFDQIDALLEQQLPAIMMLQMLDAPGRGKDLYHYIVVDGHDRGRELLRVQFGDGKSRWVRPAALERAWNRAGRALLVVRPITDRERRRTADLRRAVALERARRFDEAAATYRGLLEKEPDSALLWTNLGNAEAQAARPLEAEEAYRRALQLDPEHADATNNLAWLLLDQGRLEEAERLARKAVASGGPDRHYALETLGRIQRQNGSCREAIDTYSRALELAPSAAAERAWLWLGLGLAERDCGFEEKAIASLRQAERAGTGSAAASTARETLQALESPPR